MTPTLVSVTPRRRSPFEQPGARLAAAAAHLREWVLDAGALTEPMAREFETLASLAADLAAFTYAKRRRRWIPTTGRSGWDPNEQRPRRRPRKTPGGRGHVVD